MKCEIIRDLIPLCSEGLCSEESKREVEEHISTCAECKKLYENVPVGNENSAATPSEVQTFKKVRNKMKKSKLKIVILSLVLVVVVGIVGYLTVCQIGKFHDSKSFETIVQSMEVRKIAGYIADGDIDSYVDSISEGTIDDLYKFNYLNKMKEISKEKLRMSYNDFMKTREVDSISVDSYYVSMYSENSHSICNSVLIRFKDSSDIISLDFVKDVDGKYTVYNNSLPNDKNINTYVNTIIFANNPYLNTKGVIEIVIVKPNFYERSRPEDVADIISKRFNKNSQANVNSNLISFYNNGFIVENALFSNLKLDPDKNMLYYGVSITAKDDSGTAVMITRIYTDENGLYPSDSDYTHIYRDGCSDKLVSSLEKIFG